MRKVPTPSGPFPFQLYFEDHGPENLGCTIFNSSGAVEAILVSRLLEEQNTIPARRRVRSTVAHAAGNGLLHGSLFMEDCERLRTPVEVAQQQTTYLPTTQTINCQKVQDCSGAHRGRSVAPYRFKHALYLVPCWFFGQALMNVEPG